jgi:hypothetical protein
MEMAQFQPQLRRPMVSSGQTVQRPESSMLPSWVSMDTIKEKIYNPVVRPVLEALDLTPRDVERDTAGIRRLFTGSGTARDVVEMAMFLPPARIAAPVASGVRATTVLGLSQQVVRAKVIEPTLKLVGGAVGTTRGATITAGATVGVVATGLPEMAAEFGESLGRGIVREAKEVASDIYSAVTGGTMNQYQSPGRRELQGFREGELIKPFEIVHTWWANNVPFARLADGRTVVRRKNGSLKIFRTPKNMIVLSSNPRVKDLVRADRRIDSIVKVVKKRLPSAKRATKSRSRSTADDVQIIRTG